LLHCCKRLFQAHCLQPLWQLHYLPHSGVTIHRWIQKHILAVHLLQDALLSQMFSYPSLLIPPRGQPTTHILIFLLQIFHIH
jgi:hypothetical protein